MNDIKSKNRVCSFLGSDFEVFSTSDLVRLTMDSEKNSSLSFVHITVFEADTLYAESKTCRVMCKRVPA